MMGYCSFSISLLKSGAPESYSILLLFIKCISFYLMMSLGGWAWADAPSALVIFFAPAPTGEYCKALSGM
jgi:hypothetical protein